MIAALSAAIRQPERITILLPNFSQHEIDAGRGSSGAPLIVVSLDAPGPTRQALLQIFTGFGLTVCDTNASGCEALFGKFAPAPSAVAQGGSLLAILYVTAKRIEVAKRLLLAEEMSIASLAHRVGFVSQSHFARTFRAATGVTPRVYRCRYIAE